MFMIFDLDHTVIDSSHRQLTKPCGALDLDHWRENCTPEKIALDSLLPLAHEMRRFHAQGHIIIVCTARRVTIADMQYMADNNLPWDVFISRDHDDDRPDAEYKVARLAELAETFGFASIRDMGAQMFDDNKKVIAAMLAHGVYCHDAIHYNKYLQQKKGY